jgi:hypothetical protein
MALFLSGFCVTSALSQDARVSPSSGPGTVSVLPAPSTWKNQRGSILTIDSIDAFGKFKGTYENKAQGYPCQNTYDMNGVVKRSRLGFVVVWKGDGGKEDCRSLTVWRGSIRGNTISTRWTIAYGNADKEKVELTHGQDAFQKQ